MKDKDVIKMYYEGTTKQKSRASELLNLDLKNPKKI